MMETRTFTEHQTATSRRHRPGAHRLVYLYTSAFGKRSKHPVRYSAPHRTQSRAHVDANLRRPGGIDRLCASVRAPLEVTQNGIGDEARARRVDVTVTVTRLLTGEKAQRMHQ